MALPQYSDNSYVEQAPKKKKAAAKPKAEKPAKKAKTEKPAKKAKAEKAEKPKKKKKDPNAPKRGLSAFMFFSNDQRNKVHHYLNIAYHHLP